MASVTENILYLTDLPGFFVLPVSSRLKRPVKFDGPGSGTIIGAATAIPAFFRMQDNRWFSFLRMWYIHIDLADFHAMVAPIADFLVEQHRIVRCIDIWNSDYYQL